MSESPPAVQAEHVSHHYPGSDGPIEILREIDLRIEPGTSWALIGISGSGKTTLLSLLAGLERPSRGRIQLFGQALEELDDDERSDLRLTSIGFVFQSFHLLPTLTALENVAFPLKIRRLPDARERALTALLSVGLGDRLTHKPAVLSGGEQQRVAIARAFAGRPRILFADEPTGNLDFQSAGKVADLLFELNRLHQTTLILATHDRALAARCEHRHLLKEGVLQGNPELP
ncbi:ABC transporter ATP-binding protein YbbA [mine drainage metagenome]|uniref:ABC transporter ATP-binding protein YbbA n=2 Tax=mine drainage metagenome TaxID=410659 RepID=T1BQ08_9ZZZZ